MHFVCFDGLKWSSAPALEILGGERGAVRESVSEGGRAHGVWICGVWMMCDRDGCVFEDTVEACQCESTSTVDEDVGGDPAGR